MPTVGSLFRGVVLIFAVFCAVASGIVRSAAAQNAAPHSAAPPVIAPAPRKATALQVDYKKGLVTVEENGGAVVFAQVMTTPTVKVELVLSSKTHTGTMTLRDGNEKKLWSKTLGDGKPAKMATDFSYTKTAKGFLIELTPDDTPNDPAEDALSPKEARLTVIYGNNNQFLSGDVTTGTKRSHIAGKGHSVTVTQYENGKKTDETVVAVGTKEDAVSVTQNGKELAAVRSDKEGYTLKDSVGTITVRTVIRDGKQYTQLNLGDRSILIEGTEYQPVVNGSEIMMNVTPTTPPSSPK